MLGSIIKLGMNYILVGIPQLNIRAVPYSTLVCYVVITLMSLIALYQTVGAWNYFPLLENLCWQQILCAATARGVQNLLDGYTQSRFAVLISVAAGALVYLLALLLLRVIKKEELMTLPKGEKMAKILEKYSLLG